MPSRLGASSERIVSEIVRLLTPSYPPLDDRSRSEVHREVVRFTTAQIAALPDFLRAPYGIAIHVFDLLPLVRRRRRFVSLPADTRVAYLDAWTESRLAPFRNFVKLIRGCALLAYFDHPLVRAALEADRAANAGVAATPGIADGSSSVAPPVRAASSARS